MPYRIVFICILLFIGWILDFWSVSLGIDSESEIQKAVPTSTVSENFFSGLSSLTGIVLAGPRQDTWDKRSSVMGNNNDYIKGRLYDLTDKNA